MHWYRLAGFILVYIYNSSLFCIGYKRFTSIVGTFYSIKASICCISFFKSILKKGPQIKSYLISHPYILAGFKMWKHLNLSYAQVKTLRILYCKCVNLYLVLVKIYLIRILCQSTATRCLKTASTRCVLKIYNVTRLNLTVGFRKT